MKAFVQHGVLAHQPSPDWKGPPQAGCASNGAERRNPGKRDKMPSVAFYPTSFLAKTCRLFLQTNDAPRWKLCCVTPWRCLFYRIKWRGVWPDTECRTQFYQQRAPDY